MSTPEEYLSDGAEVYAEKNEDYGDSWRKIGEILHLLSHGKTVELETPEDHIAYGLYTRRLDKIARAFNGEFIAEDMNFESIEDAHQDEMVYAAMHASNQSARGEPSAEETVGSLLGPFADLYGAFTNYVGRLAPSGGRSGTGD